MEEVPRNDITGASHRSSNAKWNTWRGLSYGNGSRRIMETIRLVRNV